MWLGYCGLLAGWRWEKESLRIPSTRGWAIVARRRWTGETVSESAESESDGASVAATLKSEEDRACRAWALDEVNGVRSRGAFKVRVKEGKDH